MKKAKIMLGLGAVASLALASSAFAINTYNSKDYSCANLKNLVEQEGSVLLNTGFGQTTVYSAQSGCAQGIYVPASDTAFCMAGYTCDGYGGTGG